MKKIVCISDTHCQLTKFKIPDGDLLIHAGDLTYRGNVEEISKELKELGKIAKNFKYGCVFICGNHDWLGERQPNFMKQIAIDEELLYLDHSSIVVEGLNIFGSAYTPVFGNWAFNVDRKKLKKYWDQIPINTDILITHGPPMGIGDGVIKINPMKGEQQIEKVGCLELYKKIQKLNQLKLHVFGHIHQSYGITIFNKVNYINASICTESYKPLNSPIIIEL